MRRRLWLRSVMASMLALFVGTKVARATSRRVLGFIVIDRRAVINGVQRYEGDVGTVSDVDGVVQIDFPTCSRWKGDPTRAKTIFTDAEWTRLVKETMGQPDRNYLIVGLTNQ